MRRRTILVGAVAVLLASAAAWYFTSPSFALSGLRDAALAGDERELEDRIDFPKVRESLKAQMRAEVGRKLAAEKDNNPFSALGASVAMGMIDPLIEGLVTPDSMAVMIKEGQLPRDATRSVDAGGVETKWSIERDGFSRFLATPDASTSQKAPVMIFEREGLGWKLVEIRMPKDDFSGQAESPRISRPASRATSQLAQGLSSECSGYYAYIPHDIDEEVGFSVEVQPTAVEVLYTDYGHVFGKKQVQPDHSVEFNEGGGDPMWHLVCQAGKATLDIAADENDPARSFELVKSSTNIWGIAEQRGWDLGE